MCRVLNHNPYIVTLKTGMKLAHILGLDSVAAITQCTVTGAVDPLPTPPATVSRTELDDFHQTCLSALPRPERAHALSGIRDAIPL